MPKTLLAHNESGISGRVCTSAEFAASNHSVSDFILCEHLPSITDRSLIPHASLVYTLRYVSDYILEDLFHTCGVLCCCGQTWQQGEKE